MVTLLQFGDAGGVEAVAGQLRWQGDFQAAQACIGDGAGKGLQVLVAVPVDALTLPAGLAQADRLAGEKARQGLADDFEKVLVADDTNAFAGSAAGKFFQAGTGRQGVVGAAQAIDLAQVEVLKVFLMLLHQPGQYRMGLCLVFLDRAGQGVARQVYQTVQWRCGLPPDALCSGWQCLERQAQGAGAVKNLATGTAGKAQALSQGGQARGHRGGVFGVTHGRMRAPGSRLSVWQRPTRAA